MKRLEEYRVVAFTYLNSRKDYFNDNVDTYLDKALRSIANLPDKPKGHDNYNGLLGMKPVMEQRSLCLRLLLKRLVKHEGEITDADYLVDTAIRVLNNLLARPDKREPYSGLFKLEEEKEVTSEYNAAISYKVSEKGIDLIHSFESYRRCTYKDPGSNSGLPITGGFGTTRLNGKPLKLGQCYSKEVWDKAFQDDLKVFEDAIKQYVKVPITQNQFDSAVSFTYNVGIAGFASSTFLRRLNKEQYVSAAEALLMWNKGANGKVLAGLVRRRQAEKDLFLS